MKPLRIPTFDLQWLAAVVLAVACAGCSAPAVKEPVGAEPPKTVPDPKPAVGRQPDVTSADARISDQATKEVHRSLSEQELEKGIRSYEDGTYRVAVRQLQAALDFGLAARSDQATAHKYLAFIHCVSGREKACRDEFRMALATEPAFDLQPAEAGHPMWGPVFRSAKADAAKAAAQSPPPAAR